jgi:membrane fusion protein
MIALFRPEVFRRRVDSEFGEALQIVPPTQLGLSRFLVAVVVLVIIYVSFAGYSRKETVSGLIVPSRGIIRVTAPRAGTVTEVMVADGEVVSEDQVLFSVMTEETSASGTGADTAILEETKQQKAIIEGQLANEGAQSQAEKSRLEAQLQQTAAVVVQLENQRKFQRRRATAARALFDRIAPSLDKGLITAYEYANRQQTALTEEQNLAALDERLSQMHGDMEQTRLRLERLPIEEADRRATLRRSIAEVAQRTAEIEGRRRYIVRAPVSGRVTSLQIMVGRTVDSRLPQMSIVPMDDQFRAELFVPARSIGFIQPGQHVRLLYDAFPFQHFGTYGGTVQSVAATMLAPSEYLAPVSLHEPTYRVTVSLDRQSVDAFGRTMPLQPDMTLVADIVLEKRTLLDWVLEPLLSARKRMS